MRTTITIDDAVLKDLKRRAALCGTTVSRYAHRQDAPEHDHYAAWLRRLAAGPEPFAVS